MLESVMVALLEAVEALIAERELAHEPRVADAKLVAVVDAIRSELGVDDAQEAREIYARPSDALDDAKEIRVVPEPQSTADVHVVEDVDREGGPIGL
jgi:hypothetical protein